MPSTLAISSTFSSAFRDSICTQIMTLSLALRVYWPIVWLNAAGANMAPTPRTPCAHRLVGYLQALTMASACSCASHVSPLLVIILLASRPIYAYYLCLAHRDHNGVCARIQDSLHHPRLAACYPHDGGAARRRDGAYLQIHVIVINVAVLTVNKHPLEATD